MSFLSFLDGRISAYGTKSILLLIWLITLIHVFRGTRYPAVLVMITAMIAYEITGMINNYFAF
jgi:hypothetical protein